ncbi:MAG: ankyrin repeat domain-containing protein, partial [Betaproteobacteria bacterium]|nr:ankyrin repeat domain-containing protein [Betaproteobacteria bacterium]
MARKVFATTIFAASTVLLPIFPAAAAECDFLSKDFFKQATLPQVSQCLQDGADINSRTKNNWTPLYFAARANANPQIIAKLLEAGANINTRTKARWTPLHAAAKHNTNPEVIAMLLEAGADAN